MTANSYDIGQLVVITGTFRNGAGALTDPGTVSAKILDPLGVETAYSYGSNGSITRLSTGVYQQQFTAATSGKHWYSFSATGAVQSSSQNWFYVAPNYS